MTIPFHWNGHRRTELLILLREMLFSEQGFFAETVYLVKPPQPTNVIATIEKPPLPPDGGFFA
jgi:hypothetical protein